MRDTAPYHGLRVSPGKSPVLRPNAAISFWKSLTTATSPRGTALPRVGATGASAGYFRLFDRLFRQRQLDSAQPDISKMPPDRWGEPSPCDLQDQLHFIDFCAFCVLRITLSTSWRGQPLTGRQSGGNAPPLRRLYRGTTDFWLFSFSARPYFTAAHRNHSGDSYVTATSTCCGQPMRFSYKWSVA